MLHTKSPTSRPQGGTCYVCIRGCACHVSGSELSLESHIFGSKICKHELPIFGGKNFQQLPFSLSSYQVTHNSQYQTENPDNQSVYRWNRNHFHFHDRSQSAKESENFTSTKSILHKSPILVKKFPK